MLNIINIFMTVLHFFLAAWFSLGTAHVDIIWNDTFITCWNFTVLHLLQRQGFRRGGVNPVNHWVYTPVISHHGNGGSDKVMCLSDALLSLVQSAGPDISARASSCVITPQALFYNTDEVSGLAKHQRCHGAVYQRCWYCNKKESSPIFSWGHQAFKSHLWQKYVISVLHILYGSCQLHLRFQSQPQPEVKCIHSAACFIWCCFSLLVLHHKSCRLF